MKSRICIKCRKSIRYQSYILGNGQYAVHYCHECWQKRHTPSRTARPAPALAQ